MSESVPTEPPASEPTPEVALSPRNLREDPFATIEMMARVEGPTWMEQQSGIQKETATEGEWANSLANALEHLRDGRSTVVFGHGGVNRWFVRKDGTVEFSESHAQTPGHTALARRLGFVIGS